ncbi:MAG TPA: UDP-N-acetylmuramate--L-alanine ligase [Methylomirabilota bacterium]|nr:UDP-N-acetylmuramate--L-alanine ligase [Methylomirabilota bacterium]
MTGRHLHLMGIGGVGMCGLAEVLHARGITVSGCDLADSERTERLRGLGLDIRLGHDPAHLEGVDVVVHSAAVRPDTAELQAARDRGLPVVRRAVMLGELVRGGRGIAVAGTHGKTTTTALVGHLLTEAGLDPTVLVGGRTRFTGSHARVGRGEAVVCEADEFDRSFLELDPFIAVVTNLEAEHLDCYADAGEIEAAFATFCNQTSVLGRVILCRDDPGAWSLSGSVERPRLGYGLGPDAELRAAGLELDAAGCRFRVLRHGNELGEVELRLPGRFNVRNALAAMAVGLELGVPFDALAAGCASFTGVARRFDVLGSRDGVTVVDDYGHHPTELVAVLEAARQAMPGRRLVAVFQPHLYSRTRDFAEGFARALLGADVALVLPIYPARERPIAGVDASLVVAAARRLGHRAVSVGPPVADAAEAVGALLEPGDVLLTLGAGDVHRVAEAWLGGAP